MVNNESDTPADPTRLRGWLSMSLGLLAIVLGAVWTLQGLNMFEHELMSDKPIWAAVGGAVAGLGLALVIIGMRRRSSGRATA
ncbi:O-antigen/teichoic acid export membrane protein [Actinoplanes octamycinicus]|uniref:O-antigen/teichoic acid export membrane protein n=1 Tax=Actinoplanes octamycinicus TaxID=135948 RepID=A0A7W7MCV0_9ACTN|nr:hypothetical protein [Actinoplanes octamycinicus]MBB4745561.1 O-antigen/teichoic acid export membrane protein [Actinoplanes octamycinicus]GIE56404.1 hypothetical protein Aoc01nite_18060 [Actinoplanes octamycinicus]